MELPLTSSAPRPVHAGLVVAFVGSIPLLAGLTDLIRPLSGLVFAGIFAAIGGLRGSIVYVELRGDRRAADRELRLGSRAQLGSAATAWRARELTSARHRTALARSVARTERDASPAWLPGASPLNRAAVRPQADLFRRLAERLADLDRPVSARGVLEVEDLLTSSESPLYARERAHEMQASLLACVRALEGDGPASGHQQIPEGGYDERRLAATTRGHAVGNLRG